MIATRSNLPSYLVEQGVLAAGALLEGRVRVVDVHSRQRNFRVHVTDDADLFVKQASPGTSDLPLSLRREAALYEAVLFDPRFASLAGGIPAIHFYDVARRILVMEGVAEAEDLHARRLRLRRYAAPVARRLGAILGALHDIDPIGTGLAPRLPRQPPGALLVHTIPQAQAAGGPDGGWLRALLMQRPSLVAGLDRARRTWQPRGLVHHDIKSTNLLVPVTDDDDDAAAGLRVVDWELVDHGDPAWDVGSVFYDHLASYVVGLPGLGGGSAMPPDEGRAAIATFWAEYVEARGLAPGPADDELARALLYLPARFVQNVYEHLAQHRSRTPYVEAALTLADNIYRDPARARADLLAL